MIKLQRVYDFKENPEKGYSILVDRLWPRGLRKDSLKFDIWLKEAGPGNELRKWFGHDPERWKDFKKEYKKELTQNKDLMREIKGLETKHKTIVLLFSAKDQKHNQALVLKEFLDEFK